jgi:hypothetical protein
MRRAAHRAALLVAMAGSMLPARAAHAQSADERAVVAVVERFFEGMLERDSVKLRSTVDPAARLLGATMREGKQVVRATTMDQFINSVTRRQGDAANERIFAPEVRIDGNLATVWTFYTLHVGDQFSHCGIDSFQLLRLDDGWKIVSVADTRRTDGCERTG